MPYVYVSSEAKAYKKLVRGSCRQILIPGEIKLSMDVYRPRKVGDLDGRIKVLLDSMQGIYFEDDAQIVEIHARRFEDKIKPRVEITLEQVLRETPLFEAVAQAV